MKSSAKNTIVKPTVRTQMNYVPLPAKSCGGKKFPSMTLPDQTFTIQQIIDRFASGRASDIKTKETTFVGINIEVEDDLLEGVNYEQMDYPEKQAFHERLAERLQENHRRQADQKRKLEADKQAKALHAEQQIIEKAKEQLKADNPKS